MTAACLTCGMRYGLRSEVRRLGMSEMVDALRDALAAEGDKGADAAGCLRWLAMKGSPVVKARVEAARSSGGVEESKGDS